ncbi:hypothetical protein DTL70_01405 [Streptomyces diacarni]|uniref:Uncharacterized protein n=1 Tax=Streptomyces diacarni TaxID=2800381 RepID=A0A367FEI3_9ACTN|nr:hypothetical protein DTL70_01405 [Streptomyces diacarni]
MRHGAQLLYACRNATVRPNPGYSPQGVRRVLFVIDSRSIGADLSFAPPADEMAVMEGKTRRTWCSARRSRPRGCAGRRIKEYQQELRRPYHCVLLTPPNAGSRTS